MKIHQTYFAIGISFGLLFLGIAQKANGQGYQATHGSSYSGAAGIFNNPASGINAAYRWDLLLMGTQIKMTTNTAYLKNFSLGNQDSTVFRLKEGMTSKFFHTNFDLSLLNFHVKLTRKDAIGFGIRARTYSHIKTQPFQYADTMNNFRKFLLANERTPFIEGYLTHTGWTETNLNYSRIIKENSQSRFTAGITLHLLKGLSGTFLKINKASYLSSKTPIDTSFGFTNGTGRFAYSANYDVADFKEFRKKALGSLGFSLGFEYLLYPAESDEPNNPTNYDLKLGVSIMDIGGNRFEPSLNSLQFANPNQLITDQIIANKITGVTSSTELKDSLKTIFQGNTDITENFLISNPTRMVMNLDKSLGKQFYVNAELSMNFFASSQANKIRTREFNLLTLTPRWETLGLAAYLPIQYTTQGQVWVGLAGKLGPLVMGIHHLGIFKKDPLLNAGGYLMLSIHPFNKKRLQNNMDCPD